MSDPRPEPVPAGPAPAARSLLASGQIIEMHGDSHVIIKSEGAVERGFDVTPGHDAAPGQIVSVYDDGSIEFGPPR